MATFVGWGMSSSVLSALLDVVLPVFVIVALGFWYAGRWALPVGALTELIINLTGVCLILDGLTRAEPITLDTLRAPMSAVLMVAGGLGVGVGARRIFASLRGLPAGAVLLPVTFMNAGNLGLPLATLAFGDAGLQVAMLSFVTMSALMYAVGTSVIVGRSGLSTVVRIPMLHATLVGILLNYLRVELPSALATPIHLLGQTVIPLMLLSLGARLRSLVFVPAGDERPALRPVLVLVAVRLVGGVSVALLVNAVLGNTGVQAQVVLLLGLLPSAVMNFALVEQYGDDPRAAAVVSAVIAVGTGLALVLLPLGLGYIGEL